MFERNDLLPCLNCHSDPIVAHVVNVGWRVICPVCKSRTQTWKSEVAAVDAWNGGSRHRLEIERLRVSI